MTLSKMSVTLLIVAGVLLAACQPAVAPATQAPQPTQAPQATQAPQPTQAPQATQAAQPVPSGSGQQLTGTVWKWTTTQMNDGSSKTPDDPNKYLIEFLADGHVAVQADCNRVAGSYVANGNQLAITLGPSTLAACPPGSLGDEFVKQLGTIRLILV